jgi:hypothetical protein
MTKVGNVHLAFYTRFTYPMATPALYMNKDALLATLIGLGMGLIITGLIVVGPKLVSGLPKISLPKVSLPKKSQPVVPTPTPGVVALSIVSPVAESVIAKAELLVSGTAPLGSIVVVQGPTDEDVTTADSNGKYAGKILLSEGKNDVTVTSYAANKHEAQAVVVYYIQ